MLTAAEIRERHSRDRRRRRRRIVVRWIAVVAVAVGAAAAGYSAAFAFGHAHAPSAVGTPAATESTTPPAPSTAPERPSLPAHKTPALERPIAETCTPQPLPLVLLTGSSTMQSWTTSATDLAPMNTVNIGIGGTTMADQLTYLRPIVTKFTPDIIVMFAGANDLARNKPAGDVIAQVNRYVADMQAALPDTVLYFVSINTTPARAGNAAAITQVNTAISAAATADGSLRFIDTNSRLLTANGTPNSAVFAPDGVHLNDQGYSVFAQIIRDRMVADGYDQSDCVFADGTIAPEASDGSDSHTEGEQKPADHAPPHNAVTPPRS